MDLSSQVLIHSFLQYVKAMAKQINHLQSNKRKLSQVVMQIEDYIMCFKQIDLDRKGIIYPNVLQTFLIQNKNYFVPVAINRYFCKYTYEDILQALLPHSDFILVSHTISNPSQYLNKINKITQFSQTNRIQTIKKMTALIISQQIKCLNQDYQRMYQITKNNLSVGATLWRYLDQNHDNLLNYSRILIMSSKLSITISEQQWNNFLYWHFHSYKKSISRQDFMRIVDIQEKKKRASSACKIDQYHIKRQLQNEGLQQRLKDQKIKQIILKKLVQIQNMGKKIDNITNDSDFLKSISLGAPTELKGPKGYSVPRNKIKNVIQKYDSQY